MKWIYNKNALIVIQLSTNKREQGHSTFKLLCAGVGSPINSLIKEKERAFYENGSKLVEKLIASCNAKPIPIHTFSLQQLLLATNNYSSEHLAYYQAYWYKGSLEGRIVLIKRLDYWTFMVINDLVISAQMSGHSNVLKPIGVVSTLHLPFLCMN